jgi:hypothetical protein
MAEIILKNVHEFLKNFGKSKANLAKLLAASGLSYLTYKTVKIYLMRQKFKHIPGPETQG